MRSCKRYVMIVSPTDEAFYEKAKDMNKTTCNWMERDFPQAEFAYYIQRCRSRQKRMRVIFMQEIYDLFIRDIVTTAERRIWRQNIRDPSFDAGVPGWDSVV